MIHRKRITSHNEPLFSSYWQLYTSAFPDDERRPLDYQIETLDHKEYHLEAVLENDRFVGLMGWWDLETHRYIEHLATIEKVRGKGLGRIILEQYLSEDNRPILIEVEHPTQQINHRRIELYKRQGFQLNQHDYSYPPYDKDKTEYVNLLVMTYPKAISKEELENFKKRNFPTIHYRHYRAR